MIGVVLNGERLVKLSEVIVGGMSGGVGFIDLFDEADEI
jgi:hypothetical protein